MNRIITSTLAFLVLAAALCATTGLASAKEVNVTDKAFKFSKVKYWRGKAENVRLGSYGEKKTNGAYLAGEADIKAKHLSKNVKVVGPFSINFKKFGKATFGGALKYLKANGASSFSWKKAKNGKLKLVKFYINESPLKKLINKKANGALSYLKKEGSDGRVVSEIWVVVEAKFGETISKVGTFSVSSKNGNLKLTGGSNSSTTVTLPAGSTFAYLMHKVKKWNKKSGKKTSINNMEDDQPGMR